MLEHRVTEGTSERMSLTRDVERLIERVTRRGLGAKDDAARDALLAQLARWQAAHCVPFGRLARARGASFEGGPDDWPALPTEVFRYARVATFEPELDVRTFLTSGTTSGARGAHPFADLGLYDFAARAAATTALFPALADLRSFGLNLLLFFGTLYALRGLGVLAFLLPGRFATAMLISATLLFPLVGAFALGLGLGDTWLDWRSRARPTTN